MSTKRRTLRRNEGPSGGRARWGLAVVIAVEEFYKDFRGGTTGWVARAKYRIREGFPDMGLRPLNDVEIYHLMRAVLQAVRGGDWDNNKI